MRRPINFNKIEGREFKLLSGAEYRFNYNGKEDIVWSFRQPDTTPYVLAFIFHWDTNFFEIKRAKNNDGTNWIDTLYTGYFHRENMKTLVAFMDWISSMVHYYENYYHFI